MINLVKFDVISPDNNRDQTNKLYKSERIRI